MSNITYMRPKELAKPVKKPTSLKRSRVLKRKAVKFEPFADVINGEVHINHEHTPYFWAAYKRGAFTGLDPNMDAQKFRAWLVNRITSGVIHGGEAITVLGEVAEHGEIPLALVVIDYHGQLAWPDVMWSPDTSPRMKLEGNITFLLELKKQYLVMLKAERDVEPFFNHICKYGVIRKIGKARDWFGKGKHVMLYQSVGN